jgi:sulfide:quinone oxidoreductase
MSRVVVLGAGIAGHTAASYLRTWLNQSHEVLVVSPQPYYNWVPSNIWLGLGLMTEQQVTFPLAPVYSRVGILFEQARAVAIHPEGGPGAVGPYVMVEKSVPGEAVECIPIPYDYLINATGPKLNFGATEGLGPDKHTVSVCTPDHATEAAKHFLALVERMKHGDRCRFVIGTGHGLCTCQGAAFEYVVNLEFELRRHGVRDRAEVIFLSNEYELGDFGMDGAFIRRNGYITPTNIFTGSVLAERDIWSITRAHVKKVEQGRLYYESLTGEEHELTFDMAMLLPPFAGVGMQAFDRSGGEITAQVFTPNGFMEGCGLAQNLPESGLSKHLCGGYRLCPAPLHFTSPYQPQGYADLCYGSADRNAFRHHRPRGCPQHRGQDTGERWSALFGFHGGVGRRLRRLLRLQPAERNRGIDDGLSHRSRL